MNKTNEIIKLDIENMLEDICKNFEYQADIDFILDRNEYTKDEREVFYELFKNYELTWMDYS